MTSAVARPLLYIDHTYQRVGWGLTDPGLYLIHPDGAPSRVWQPNRDRHASPVRALQALALSAHPTRQAVGDPDRPVIAVAFAAEAYCVDIDDTDPRRYQDPSEHDARYLARYVWSADADGDIRILRRFAGEDEPEWLDVDDDELAQVPTALRMLCCDLASPTPRSVLPRRPRPRPRVDAPTMELRALNV
jgi:hypothetical protein